MANTYNSPKTRNWGQILMLVIPAILVLGGVAFGVNYLWDKRFGPTEASAADCKLAQQMFDQAAAMPSDKTGAEKLKTELRRTGQQKFENDGVQTQVNLYAYWAAVKATGGTDRPQEGQLQNIYDEVEGHCDDSGVTVTIKKITF